MSRVLRWLRALWARLFRRTPPVQGRPIRGARLAKVLYQQVQASRLDDVDDEAIVQTYARMVAPSFEVAKLIVARWHAMTRGERARAARNVRDQVAKLMGQQGANPLNPLDVDGQTYTSDSATLEGSNS